MKKGKDMVSFYLFGFGLFGIALIFLGQCIREKALRMKEKELDENISSARNVYQEVFNRLWGLVIKNPDTATWEQETSNLVLILTNL